MVLKAFRALEFVNAGAVTNIAMGTEINAITEFEEVVDLPSEIGVEAENMVA